MRRKEEAHDYRYFPDPDLVPVVIKEDWVAKVRAELPELPQAKRERFVNEYQIPAYDAGVLTADKALAHKLPNKVEAAYRRTDFFEKRRSLMKQWADYLSNRTPAASRAAAEPTSARAAA